jgi:phosphoglycolate phosphatase
MITEQPVRGVIFDLDGTLCNTLGDIAHAVNCALERVGGRPHPVEAYAEWVGWGLSALCRAAIGEEQGERFDRMVELAVAEYNTFPMGRSFPYPGVTELLDELTRLDVPMGVVSNKPHDFAAKIIEEMYAPWSFVKVEGNRDGRPRKPDPSGALAIATAMALRPGEIALVGDSSVDMETARNARMLPVGVSWGFRGPDELDEAARIIHRPQELLELVAR